MNRPMIAVVAGLFVAACAVGGAAGAGASGGSRVRAPRPPRDSYNLRAAMAAFEMNPSTSRVSLSGTKAGGTKSVPFTGSGTLTYGRGTTGTFNGWPALLRTTTIEGDITLGGMRRSEPTAYTSEVTDAYERKTAAILGMSRNGEFDVAPAPILIPSMVGTSPIMLGILRRYTDDTLRVALGTLRISVVVALLPVDPGSPEVVRFTFKSYDVNRTAVQTVTRSYYLSRVDVLSFYGETVTDASGSLSVRPR